MSRTMFLLAALAVAAAVLLLDLLFFRRPQDHPRPRQAPPCCPKPAEPPPEPAGPQCGVCQPVPPAARLPR